MDEVQTERQKQGEGCVRVHVCVCVCVLQKCMALGVCSYESWATVNSPSF